jgi:hypothetical protein
MTLSFVASNVLKNSIACISYITIKLR